MNAMSGPLQSIPNQKLVEDSDPQKRKLREVCNDFEAVMVSIVLKEGLNGAKELGSDPSDETDSGTETFKNFAYEQMSYCIGKTGLLGLGDQIFESMKDRVSSENSKKRPAPAESAAASSENALGRLIE